MQEDPGHRKRKADEVPSSIFGTSRIRRSKIETVEAEPQWPDYFIEAVNTVLAFCTSRKQFATSFNSLRASIESLLKRKQNDVFFNYVIHRAQYDEDEHVLVLEMDDSMVRPKRSSDSQVSLEPLHPGAVKQLIEKRNAIFSKAVNELIEAFSDAEDPVALLVASAQELIPLNTSGRTADLSHIPDPENRQPIAQIIEEFHHEKWYHKQIRHRRTIDAKVASLGTPDPPLSESIAVALRDARKITTLYTHQTNAIAALSKGKDVIVSTSTASGKSVIYQVPLLRMLEQDKGTKALFIYPTKALAQDQKAALEGLLACCRGLESTFVSTYDGDTPQESRPTIRDTASVLFTNIDTIHASILPHEERWRRFLKNLRLVAVDELHYYHDMFGSNVALVMRRLRRICAAVGNRRIRFVSCSATISRPKEHMKAIFGLEDVEAITQDGAPSGEKEFLLWSTPLSSNASPIAQATKIMSFLMKRGVRVILFCKTRKDCELAMKTLRTSLSMEKRHDVLDRVMPYRGGYQPLERRKIEHEAFSGKLLGLVATNALELGVDIGVLDAVIVCGFPMSLASFRQQIGRAGRRARDSLAIFVTDIGGIDNHYIAYPDDLFDKPTPDLVVDLESPLVIEAHLQCAAFEMPLSRDDACWFGPLTTTLCETKLVRDKEGWYGDVTSAALGVRGRILEETEISRALFELYEGAIFLHQGKPFIVREINHDSKQARLVRTDVDWITAPRDVDPVQTWRIREIKGSPRRAQYGRVDVRTVVYGAMSDLRVLEKVEVEMPPYENTTTGMWIDVSKAALHFLGIEGISCAAAIHCATHAFLNQFPMAADLRTECRSDDNDNDEGKPAEALRTRPARDSPGNNGPGASDLLLRALEAVSSCDCEEGCENCIVSSLCRRGDFGAKKGALVVLRDILGIPLGESVPSEVTIVPRPTTVEAPSVGIAEGVVVEKFDA
ncbi:P-loop containing nucleoside triphosphate hydrolase protein [Russula vinacea]|nr:P-loop containing nucleoside triphosphate hydrolase protein [Russula vinacea]